MIWEKHMAGRRMMYTKQTGSRWIRFVLLIILAFILTGCGLGDWNYDLPNGYAIWRINSQDIALVKLENEYSGTCVIDRYILEFCYNDTYIGIKRLMVDESIPYQDVNIETMDHSNPSYYLVNTLEDKVMGPYTAEEYDDQIKAMGVETMCDWIKTVPKPDGAK